MAKKTFERERNKGDKNYREVWEDNRISLFAQYLGTSFGLKDGCMLNNFKKHLIEALIQ